MAALSCLSPEQVGENGLPTEAVLGEVDPNRPDMTIEQFTPNDAFLTFLHNIIAEHAHQLPVLQAQAEKVKNGPVYVMDYRTINQGGKPPFEDCLGWYGVSNGEILVDTYNPSAHYKLMTNAGPIELHSVLEGKLLAQLAAVVDAM